MKKTLIFTGNSCNVVHKGWSFQVTFKYEALEHKQGCFRFPFKNIFLESILHISLLGESQGQCVALSVAGKQRCRSFLRGEETCSFELERFPPVNRIFLSNRDRFWQLVTPSLSSGQDWDHQRRAKNGFGSCTTDTDGTGHGWTRTVASKWLTLISSFLSARRTFRSGCRVCHWLPMPSSVQVLH